MQNIVYECYLDLVTATITFCEAAPHGFHFIFTSSVVEQFLLIPVPILFTR